MSDILLIVGILGGAFAWIYSIVHGIETRIEELEKKLVHLEDELGNHAKDSQHRHKELLEVIAKLILDGDKHAF